MAILSRISTWLKANINDMIGKAEDPQKMLEQAILDMNQSIIEARQQVAMAIADEKRLAKQLDTEANASKEWEKKAILAVEKGEDELAREALKRQEQAASLALQYQTQWNQQSAMVAKLKEQLKILTDKVQEATRKKDLLIARQKRAEAQQTISKTMSSINDPGAFDTFSRMEKKVDQIEAEADAEVELQRDISGSSLEDKFKALEAGTVDDKLAQLKLRLGKTDTKALPEN